MRQSQSHGDGQVYLPGEKKKDLQRPQDETELDVFEELEQVGEDEAWE